MRLLRRDAIPYSLADYEQVGGIDTLRAIETCQLLPTDRELVGRVRHVVCLQKKLADTELKGP